MRRLALCLGLALLVAACAGNFKATTYQTLDVSATTYETAMEAMDDLYRQGLIDDSTVSEAKDLAKIYHAAYHSAVEAFHTYCLYEDEESEKTLEEKMEARQEALDKFVEYVRPILQRYLVKEE